MRITILTLFPDMFSGPFQHSIIKRAQEKRMVTIHLVNIRDFALDRHGTVDDRPYGGGVGMILRVDVVDRALRSTKHEIRHTKLATRTILLDPQGIPYTQDKAQELSTLDHLILICGHYEGVDERIRKLVDEELSVGDYILTGGEIAAMAVTDSTVRLIPGVLAKEFATHTESFTDRSLEYPQYTRPARYKRLRVPPILMTGNHARIEAWRKRESKRRTKIRRPDILEAKST